MSPAELVSMFGKDGLSGRHSIQILNNIFKRSITGITGIKGVPVILLRIISARCKSGLFPPLSEEVSADGSVKYLFLNNEGKKFEAVYLPEEKRKTICVSSQSGCRMGCRFCLTGRFGFHGNLSAGDIVNQVLSIPYSHEITHVVFMGMGEPLDNPDNVLKASEILTAEWGRALSPRNITISTVGLTPVVKRFLNESNCNLTVSLFSPFTEERRKAVPAENKYPVSEIIDILRNATLRKKRRLTMSYLMIRDFNDTEAHLAELRKLLSGTGIRVNLLPYHEGADDDYKSSTAERMQYFRHNLVISGISASVRKSRGQDISAACGLLASGLQK